MRAGFWVLFPLFLIFTILTFLVSNHFFFWDTVKLVALPASFIFDNNFEEIFLPNNFDTGHLPVFPLYLAIVWKVFSKTLEVSHFAMLPFLFGIIFQSYLLIKNYISNKVFTFLILSLALFNPIFLSQSTLVSPDILLLFFFLLGVNSLKSKNNNLYALSLIALFSVSTRGVMTVVVLFLVELILILQKRELKGVLRANYSMVFKYLPGAILFVLYNYLHYLQSGWILLNPNVNWSSGHVKNDFNGAVYNVGIFIWRLIDFGMLFVWMVLVSLLIKYKKLVLRNKVIRNYMLYLIVLLFLFFSLYLRYSYFTQHRYLLPIYFLASILTGCFIVQFVKSDKVKNMLFAFCFVGLLVGNLLVYPNKIAQGWDSTLAHLPYYSLQHKMLAYLKNENIKLEDVGAEFPVLEEQRYIMLNNNIHAFKKKEVDKDIYILYTTINNDFSDEELELLQSNYILKKEFKSMQIVVQLYEKLN